MQVKSSAGSVRIAMPDGPAFLSAPRTISIVIATMEAAVMTAPIARGDTTTGGTYWYLRYMLG
jgi:hypothetical protein